MRALRSNTLLMGQRVLAVPIGLGGCGVAHKGTPRVSLPQPPALSVLFLRT